MDPQTCLDDIIYLVDHGDGDWEELNEKMSALWRWLFNGGWSPKCTSLGYTKWGPRKYIHNLTKTLAIMSIDPNDISKGFCMVNYRGDLTEVFNFTY